MSKLISGRRVFSSRAEDASASIPAVVVKEGAADSTLVLRVWCIYSTNNYLVAVHYKTLLSYELATNCFPLWLLAHSVNPPFVCSLFTTHDVAEQASKWLSNPCWTELQAACYYHEVNLALTLVAALLNNLGYCQWLAGQIPRVSWYANIA